MKYYIELKGIKHEVEVLESENLKKVKIDGEVVELDFPPLTSKSSVSFIINHKTYSANISAEDINLNVQINNFEIQAVVKDERRKLMDTLMRQSKRQSNSVSEIKALMPGLIIKLNVSTGDSVKKGNSLIVMEAMKMENEINAPMDSIVEQCHVKTNQAVSKGQLLISLRDA